MAELHWQTESDGARRLFSGKRELALLGTGAGIAAVNTPKPYIHPLRSPNGTVITGFAPEDHRWHQGLEFAMPRVDAHNLWGGGTYFSPEEGYRVVADQGEIEHQAWSDEQSGAVASISETNRWVGHGREPLLAESRRWRFAMKDAGDTRVLVVDFRTELRGLTGAPVALNTPAQRGRPDGGYGGLFLRLCEGFQASAILGEQADLTESGGQSPTMIVHGSTTGTDRVTLGLAFRDGPTPGGRYWLHRFEPFCAIGWAVAYVDGLEVPIDEPMIFEHRLAIADGHLSPEQLRLALAADLG